MRHDPDVGWINTPSRFWPDMYGPGVFLRTNGQGFRADHDFTVGVPAGKRRIICSGDSFTLGYGVDDDHAWCARLATLDPRLETVNAGQAGYGVDQAYLLYRRDASRLDHYIHLFVFITEDFRRMLFDTFLGNGKPVLRIENGALVTRNVPVPTPNPILAWSAANDIALRHFRTIDFLRRLLWKAGWASISPDKREKAEEGKRRAELEQILVRVFDDLRRQSEARASKLVLVYLPTLDELEGDGPQEWMRFVRQSATDLRIPLIDLHGAFRSLSYGQALSKYIPAGQISYAFAAGHLSIEGNAFVASLIHDALKSDPQLSH